LGEAIGLEALESGLPIRWQATKARNWLLSKDARTRRDEAKRLLDDGLDPSQQKCIAKLAATAQNANTFSTIADELLAQKRREGKAPATIAKLEWLFGLAKPALGARPITAIEAPEILQVLRRRGARQAGNGAPPSLYRRIGLPLCGGDRTRLQRSDRGPAWSFDRADRSASRSHC
jgi:integrase-like protein